MDDVVARAWADFQHFIEIRQVVVYGFTHACKPLLQLNFSRTSDHDHLPFADSTQNLHVGVGLNPDLDRNEVHKIVVSVKGGAIKPDDVRAAITCGSGRKQTSPYSCPWSNQPRRW